MEVVPKAEKVIINHSPLETITPDVSDVSGMKCAGGVKAVERQLTQQIGVISARVNLATEVATVECETNLIDPSTLAQRLTDNGFPTQPRLDNSENYAAKKQTERHRQEMKQQIWRIAIASLLLIMSGIGHLGHFTGSEIPILGNIWFHAVLASLALFVPGQEIIIDGARSLLRNAPNMNTLVGFCLLYTSDAADED